MPVVQIQADLPPDALLAAVKQLSEPELEQFAQQVNALVAKRKAPSLPHTEADLLLKINQGIPLDLQQRYNELIAKRQAEMLTADEYGDLLRLTQQVESLETRRVEYLAELARLRGITLTELLHNLGIEAPAYG